MNSYETAAITGINANLIKNFAIQLGLVKIENSRIEITKTMIMKVVPQRGCRQLKPFAFFTVNSFPLS